MNKRRLLTFLILIVVIPMGFYTGFYEGPGEAWIRNSMGGFVYEIFWCLLAALVWPLAKPIKIALWVFAATCFLEVLQLWHPPLLEAIRSNFLGRTLLGNSFNWMDMPYYLAGSALGWLLLLAIHKMASTSQHTSDPR